MWIGIAIGVTFIFVVGYALWSVANHQSSTTRAVVPAILALILGIFWICSAWAQSDLNEIKQIKQNEVKAYYDKCIVETRHEVNGKLQSYTKTDICIK